MYCIDEMWKGRTTTEMYWEKAKESKGLRWKGEEKVKEVYKENAKEKMYGFEELRREINVQRKLWKKHWKKRETGKRKKL